MIANALVAASAVVLALLFWLMQDLTFLIPYRRVLFHDYGTALGLWAALVFVNLFAAFYALGRTVFLKDTGQKLAHLEKQIRSSSRISDELRSHLDE